MDQLWGSLQYIVTCPHETGTKIDKLTFPFRCVKKLFLSWRLLRRAEERKIRLTIDKIKQQPP
jgi:hypothetical protein